MDTTATDHDTAGANADTPASNTTAAKPTRPRRPPKRATSNQSKWLMTLGLAVAVGLIAVLVFAPRPSPAPEPITSRVGVDTGSSFQGYAMPTDPTLIAEIDVDDDPTIQTTFEYGSNWFDPEYVAVADDLVIVIGFDQSPEHQRLVAYDPDGNTAWTTDLEECKMHSPDTDISPYDWGRLRVFDGVLIVYIDGCTFGIRAIDGEQLWRHEPFAWSVFRDGTLYGLDSQYPFHSRVVAIDVAEVGPWI